jgi:hypothetical protein
MIGMPRYWKTKTLESLQAKSLGARHSKCLKRDSLTERNLSVLIIITLFRTVNFNNKHRYKYNDHSLS